MIFIVFFAAVFSTHANICDRSAKLMALEPGPGANLFVRLQFVCKSQLDVGQKGTSMWWMSRLHLLAGHDVFTNRSCLSPLSILYYQCSNCEYIMRWLVPFAGGMHGRASGTTEHHIPTVVGPRLSCRVEGRPLLLGNIHPDSRTPEGRGRAVF